ncbi:MAG: SusC/RagA family TonB-linked outer membrane protein [Marinilabiliales bacterium]|nr:SusC/RagA family TonB-linked outer membrane protein [Marinilabiliales bacterium]
MRKISLLLVFLSFLGLQVVFAQTRQITGIVTSGEDGTSIPGVSVVVKGSTLGTITDMDGKFTLKVPQGSKTLAVSFVGMSSLEVALTSASEYKIVMKAETQSVDEVIVTAMGIKRKPKEMGVATAKVDNQELTSAGATNVMNGMAAKVSGLQINTINNGVNPDTKITLRGNRHFLATNQALVVLDGVPVSATYLNSINPNDIADVNILKGASAAALYGNDASNGVMIVTTKKGDKGKLTVKVSNITTFEQVSTLPNLQERFGGGSSETTSNSDPNYTMWLGPDRNTDPYTSYENQTFGPEFNGQMVILGGKLADGSYQMIPYSAVKNQKKNFFQTGVTMQNDISVSGGDDKGHFYLSAQDVKSTGTIPDDTNRRTSARMAAGRKYGIFSADYSLSFTRTKTSVSGGDMNQNRGVYWNVLNTPPEVPITKYKDIVNNPFAELNGYFNAYYPNPYWQLKHSRQNQMRNDLMGSVNLSLKPTKWLEFTNRSGIVYNGINNHNYKDEAVYNEYSATDPWSQGHMGYPADGGKTFKTYAGTSSDQMRNTVILTNDFLATFDKKFGDLSVKGILGNSVYSQKYETIYDAASGGLVIPGLYNISNRVGNPAVTQTTLERNSLGIFGDVTLGYKEYAFLHFSGRNDWDSRLTKANRSFFYPAVDASIILSQMFPSIIDNQVLSFAKIRGGYSQTGQISLSDWYGTLPSYSAAGGFPFGAVAGFALGTTLSNPLLKPEKTKETEIGLELSFLKNKIHLETNAYISKTMDQTIPANLSSATGYYSAFINAGEMDNKGAEVDLKLTPLLSLGKLAWNVSFAYSYMTSEVISILPGTLNELAVNDQSNTSLTTATYAIVGQQFPSIKVTDVKRDPNGNIIVSPITGLPSKQDALVNVGHGNPNHILGISTDITYKGWRLAATAEYRGGNVIVNAVGNALDFTGVSEHSAQNGRQSFIIPGAVIETSPGVYTPNTTALVANTGRQFWVNSDYHTTNRAYTTSAAFWKLREVSLSYDIPVKKLFGGNVLQDAQVALMGRNLLMLRPKTNVWTDPEFNNTSTTSNAVGYTTEDQTPPTRVYGFSVKFTF